jgi:hypothetical protein
MPQLKHVRANLRKCLPKFRRGACANLRTGSSVAPMNTKTKVAIAAIAFAALSLTGCAPGPAVDLNPDSNVQTADGPAQEPVDEGSYHGEPDQPSSVSVPSFHQKYVYKDGVEVEITQIDKGRLTRQQAADEYEENIKSGMGWVRLTGRIKNGSKETLDASLVSISVSYGPDGREPLRLYFNDDSDFDGKILPSRAKSAEATFAIPEKYWGDVVAEITIGDDFYRETVIFAGSVK